MGKSSLFVPERRKNNKGEMGLAEEGEEKKT